MALEVCDRSDHYNRVCNASFEEVSRSNSELPQGWDFADDYPLSYDSRSRARVSSDRPYSGKHCLQIEPRDESIGLDSSELIPVRAGEPYQLRMRYRIDRVDGDPRGRIVLAARYYDAEGELIVHRVCSGDRRIACQSDEECGDRGSLQPQIRGVPPGGDVLFPGGLSRVAQRPDDHHTRPLPRCHLLEPGAPGSELRLRGEGSRLCTAADRQQPLLRGQDVGGGHLAVPDLQRPTRSAARRSGGL